VTILQPAAVAGGLDTAAAKDGRWRMRSAASLSTIRAFASSVPAPLTRANNGVNNGPHNLPTKNKINCLAATLRRHPSAINHLDGTSRNCGFRCTKNAGNVFGSNELEAGFSNRVRSGARPRPFHAGQPPPARRDCKRPPFPLRKRRESNRERPCMPRHGSCPCVVLLYRFQVPLNRKWS
jgi:hypothetical protein